MRTVTVERVYLPIGEFWTYTATFKEGEAVVARKSNRGFDAELVRLITTWLSNESVAVY